MHWFCGRNVSLRVVVFLFAPAQLLHPLVFSDQAVDAINMLVVMIGAFGLSELLFCDWPEGVTSFRVVRGGL